MISHRSAQDTQTHTKQCTAIYIKTKALLNAVFSCILFIALCFIVTFHVFFFLTNYEWSLTFPIWLVLQFSQT